VFSDSHEVFAPECVFKLGTFGVSGGFLVEVRNRRSGSEQCDYIDFFMETIRLTRRADF
jgi:hypothetical protein